MCYENTHVTKYIYMVYKFVILYNMAILTLHTGSEAMNILVDRKQGTNKSIDILLYKFHVFEWTLFACLASFCNILNGKFKARYVTV